MNPPTLRPLSLGEILDVSFGLYRALFTPLLTVALICRAAPALLSVYIGASEGASGHLVLALLILLLSLVLGTIGAAATTFIVSDSYLGRATTAAAALHRSLPLIVRLIEISLNVGVRVVLGTILLFVPGLIVFSGYFVSTAVAVLESPPTSSAALGRSWELTRGYKGKVFGTVFVGFLLLSIPGMGLSLFTGPGASGVQALGVLAVQAILEVLLYPLLYVLPTVIYYDLRVRKEGFDLELLASALQPA
jgi:hypothetical protein